VKRRFNQFISLFKKTGFEADLHHLLGYRTGNVLLFQTALNHRSVKDNPTENNERLEFLGDAVIGTAVADYLFKKYPVLIFLNHLLQKLIKIYNCNFNKCKNLKKKYSKIFTTHFINI
jgi:hypothetical protein